MLRRQLRMMFLAIAVPLLRAKPGQLLAAKSAALPGIAGRRQWQGAMLCRKRTRRCALQARSATFVLSRMFYIVGCSSWHLSVDSAASDES